MSGGGSSATAGLALLALHGAILLAFAGALLNGFVLAQVWNWYVVPVFHLARLGAIGGIGCCLVISTATFRPTVGAVDSDWVDLARQTVTFALLELILAWVGHFFA